MADKFKRRLMLSCITENAIKGYYGYYFDGIVLSVHVLFYTSPIYCVVVPRASQRADGFLGYYIHLSHHMVL